MTAGQMRHQITIQQPSTGACDLSAFDSQSFDVHPDTQGGRSVRWGTYATAWACVEPVTGAERIQAEAMGAQLNYQVTTRYRVDVVPSMRLAWTPYGGSSKTLQIHGVHPVDGRREFVRLLCGEVA